MDRTELRKVLEQFFDEAELRTLCFDLGIDYDGLPGEGKGEKARELVAYAYRHGREVELLWAIRQERPNAFWRDVVERTMEEGTRPTREIPVMALRQASGRTGPLREDYRALLKLSLERVHKRLDDLSELVGSVRTVAVVALVLAITLAVVMAGVVMVLIGR